MWNMATPAGTLPVKVCSQCGISLNTEHEDVASCIYFTRHYMAGTWDTTGSVETMHAHKVQLGRNTSPIETNRFSPDIRVSRRRRKPPLVDNS